MVFGQSFDFSFPSRADSPRQRETTAEDTGAGKGLFGWGDLGAVGVDGIPSFVIHKPKPIAGICMCVVIIAHPFFETG